MAVLPAKVEVAVLVDRKHKNFPIKSDYVGLSLATTVKDDIDVQMVDAAEYGSVLEVDFDSSILVAESSIHSFPFFKSILLCLSG